MRTTRASILASVCALLMIQTASAQRIKVAVSMTDSATGGIFQSAFGAAFRSLGDVDVVTLDESPDYVLEGVVLCHQSSCADVVSYALSLRLYEPATYSTAQLMATVVVPWTAQRRAKTVDSIATLIWPWLKPFQQSRMTWTATWGRNRYEQALREFVRKIDSGCLDKIRALKRLGVSPDSNALNAFVNFERSRPWFC